MLLLNTEDMRAAVTKGDMIEAVENAYAVLKSGKYVMPDRFVAQREERLLEYMPCFTDSIIGTKMLAEFPDNPKRGYPILSGLVILNDPENGQPLCIMNGGAITAMRTGANGGTAIKYLAPEDADSAGLVGCGVQGISQLAYACFVRPVKKIYLYDAFRKDFDTYIDVLKEELPDPGIQIEVCSNTTELAEKSTIIITATTASDPVFPDDTELLKGKTFIAIGSWRPAKRELPDAVWKLAKHAYIDLPYACEESGDLKIPLDTGVLKKEQICLLQDLIADVKEGISPDENETRVFKTVGMAILDACSGEMIYRSAMEMGFGQEVKW